MIQLYPRDLSARPGAGVPPRQPLDLTTAPAKGVGHFGARIGEGVSVDEVLVVG